MFDKSQAISFAYLRKSRDPQEREAAGALAGQHAILVHLAERDGLPLSEERIFAEVRSGEHLAARPEFGRLLTSLAALPDESEPILYCTHEDRLGRGIATERGIIQDALIAARVTIRTPGGVIRLTNADETLLFEVKGSLARLTLQRYKEQVELRRVEQVREGLIRTGAPPWGYLWDRNREGRGRLVPHPENFPLLAMACKEVIHTSLYRLAKEIGIHHSTLCWTLRNPTICGWPARRWRAERSPGERRHRPLPRSEWVWPTKPGDYPAACTREEWERIQQALDRRYKLKGRTGFDAEGWCRDVVQFVDCPGGVRLGSRGIPKRWTYEKDDERGHRYYIDRRPVHEAAYNGLLKALQEPEMLLLEGRAYQKRQTGDAGSLGALESVTADLERLRQRLDRLNEERLDLEDTEQVASNGRIRAKLKSEIRGKAREWERLQSPRAAAPEMTEALALLQKTGPMFAEFFPELSGSEKRLLAGCVLASLPVKITPVPGKRAHLREVLEPVYQAWVPLSEKER